MDILNSLQRAASACRRKELHLADFLESIPGVFDQGLQSLASALDESHGRGDSHGDTYTRDWATEKVENFFGRLSANLDHAFNRHGVLLSSSTTLFQIPIAAFVETTHFGAQMMAGAFDTGLETSQQAMAGHTAQGVLRPIRSLVVGAIGTMTHALALQPRAYAFVLGKITGEEEREATPFFVSQSMTHAALTVASAMVIAEGITRGGLRVMNRGAGLLESIKSSVRSLAESFSSSESLVAEAVGGPLVMMMEEESNSTRPKPGGSSFPIESPAEVVLPNTDAGTLRTLARSLIGKLKGAGWTSTEILRWINDILAVKDGTLPPYQRSTGMRGRQSRIMARYIVRAFDQVHLSPAKTARFISSCLERLLELANEQFPPESP